MPYRISTAILLYLIGFTYSRRSAERHQLCEICYCPYNISQDPYIINCKALNLANIPLWNDNSVIDNSEISNIHLELSYNALITIPLIAASENIQELDLSNSQISGIDPFAFAQLKCLKRLSLSNNNIEMLHPKTFNAATQEDHLKLEILDLSNNKIHHLDGDLFEDVPNLKELNLAVNPLGVLDVSTVIALNSVNGLQYLNMADTGVRELPDTLINPIQHLRKFNLSTNLLKRVPEVLQHGTKMTELILSNNLMQELDASSFVELDSLQTLEINNMPQLVIIHKGSQFKNLFFYILLIDRYYICQ